MSFPLFVSHKKLRKDAVQFSADCVLHKRRKKQTLLDSRRGGFFIRIKNAKAIDILIFSLSRCCCYILSVRAAVQHSGRFLPFCCFIHHIF